MLRSWGFLMFYLRLPILPVRILIFGAFDFFGFVNTLPLLAADPLPSLVIFPEVEEAEPEAGGTVLPLRFTVASASGDRLKMLPVRFTVIGGAIFLSSAVGVRYVCFGLCVS